MTAPDRYAVIGNPIAHSRSPAIHEMFARQTGQSIRYDALLAPVDGFEVAVDAFRGQGGRGLNVTLPFKERAFAYADRLTERARVAGAVNTLAFDDARALGDNTDGAGLVGDIERRIGCALHGARLLLLGAGGAARGVILPLLDAGVERITVINRTEGRARELASAFAGRAAGRHLGAAGYPAFERPCPGFDLIVNATASGLGDQSPPVPPAWFDGVRLAYDMVYSDAPTRFMALAADSGCARVEDGLGMLVGQAAESFFVWRGVRPRIDDVYAALRPGAPARSPRARAGVRDPSRE